MSPHEMHSFGYWEATARRGPRWTMRDTRNIPDSGWEGLQVWFLLANCKERRNRVSPEM
jgi:hypothetical protein